MKAGAPVNVHAEVRRLMRLPVAALREEYLAVFGEPTRSGNKPYLVKRIVWRLQANAYGGLSERARRRAEELAVGAQVRSRPSVTTARALDQVLQESYLPHRDPALPRSGNEIRRIYKGRELVVRAVPGGFAFDGEVYKSLTAIARKVTGSHWNGRHFFGLRENA